MTKLTRHIPTVARLFFGGLFLFSGLNGLFQFAPMPPMPAAAGSFLGALAATGYFFPLLKLTEIAMAVLILANRFVPLALIVLAPIMVNIVFFHAVLAPAGMGMVALLLVAGLYLAWHHRDAYRPLFQAKPRTEPFTVAPTRNDRVASAL